MAQDIEIAILGATPAGYAAAYSLARKGRRVTLLDAPAHASESPLADWVPREFFDVTGLPKTLDKASGAKLFKEVVYHNADLSKRVDFSGKAAIGYFLEVKELTAALRKQAVAAGAKVRTCRQRPAMRLLEDRIELGSSPTTSARLLLIASSGPRDIVNDLALPTQNLPPPPMVVAAVDIPVGAKGRSLQGALHVVETRDRSDLGMFLVAEGRLHIRLISASVASGSRAAELSGLVARLQKVGIVPADLALGKASGAVWHPPAGMALELETHVAKRCMLVGTAGGFAESITGQTLYPGVKSALIAADIADAAIDHARTQEELMKFKTHWRKNLADYLRPPNTSLQMLLPLLFVNKQIVAKFTRALLLGEPI